MKATILETPRLLVREMDEADLTFITSMLGDEEVMRYWGRSFTRADALEWIRRQQDRYERDGFGYWIALSKETGEPVGQVGILNVDVDGETKPGLGYILHRSFWGRGLASEAAAAALDYAFDTLQISRVLCLIRPENKPSLGVATKLGLRLRRKTMFHGFEHLVYEARRDAPR